MRQFILGFSFLTVSLLATGQENGSLNQDSWKMRFSFLTGINYTGEPQVAPRGGHLGFSCGLAMEYRLTKKAFIYPQIIFSFLEWGNSVQTTVQSSTVEFPLHLLYKPFGTKVKPTVSLGANYKALLGLFGDIGIGLEKQLKYFTIAPELRFSFKPDYVTNTTRPHRLQTIYLIINFRG